MDYILFYQLYQTLNLMEVTVVNLILYGLYSFLENHVWIEFTNGVVNLILYGLYSFQEYAHDNEQFTDGRKPYFIWTIFFSSVTWENTDELAGKS